MTSLAWRAAVAVGAWWFVGCGRTANSDQNDGGGGSAVVGSGSGGAAGSPETSGGAADAAPSVADNGVAIPARDPRDSCDGLGLERGDCDANGNCDSVSCACPTLTPVVTHVLCTASCVAAIDCAAYCGLGSAAETTALLCSIEGLCEADAACMPSEHCLKPPNAKVGSCTRGDAGSPCYADGDCLSGACVVTDASGEGRCDATGLCNRARQCGEKKCVIAPDRFVGSCSDGNVGSACVTGKDCAEALGCAALRPDFVVGALGACTDGALGSPCAPGSACLPGLNCDGRRGLCFASALGEPCETNADCPDGFCSTAPDQPGCTSGEEGEACADATQCQTPFCVADRCTTGKPGSPCVMHSDCEGARTCVATTLRCTHGQPGQPCDAEAPCKDQLVCVDLVCSTR